MKLFTLLSLAFVLTILPPKAVAFNIGTAIGLGHGKSVTGTYNSFTDIIANILPNAYILAGIILLFFLFFGGITIIMGGGNPEKSAKGKQTITGAIIGFVIIFASYWIIQIIQILTGVNILNSGII